MKPTQYTRKITINKQGGTTKQTQPPKESTTADHQYTLKKIHSKVKTCLQKTK
jgi:hypothetical protein